MENHSIRSLREKGGIMIPVHRGFPYEHIMSPGDVQCFFHVPGYRGIALEFLLRKLFGLRSNC